MNLTDDALDVQGELFGYYSSTFGARYAAAEMGFAAHAMKLVPEDPFTTIGQVAEVDGPRIYRDLLRTAATYAVTTDIATVLGAALQSIKMYPLHLTDLPSPNGFVWLESGLVLADDTPEAKPVVVRAFGWRSMRDGTGELGAVFLLWTDPNDSRDHSYNDDFSAGLVPGGIPPRGLWSMIGGLWKYGEEPPQHSQGFALLLSFLRFIDEPWLSGTTRPPSRHAGRRAARVGLEPLVRVVELRRRRHDPETAQNGSGSTWSHRVLVGAATGGFWRNQWYPSKGEHRPRWIWPYEAGPADKPLLVKDVVYRVDR